jgi:hypothetical protein
MFPRIYVAIKGMATAPITHPGIPACDKAKVETP